MIAFHYPPFGTSSGLLRTLKFSRYLMDHGWTPIVLTVHPRAYATVRDDMLARIPNGIVVKRAFALDTARHLCIKGRYPGFLARPDRWASWWLGAVPQGLQIIREHKPDLLWSTYPIASAHLIALTLQRLSGMPWVADFRDPMVEEGSPSDPATRRVYGWIERRVVSRAARCVLTTPGTLQRYKMRFPSVLNEKWALIPNGYDEEDFAHIENAAIRPVARRSDAPIVLLHSGTLYPSERDPSAFFSALAELHVKGVLGANSLRVIFRGSGHDERYRGVVAAMGIQEFVTFEPAIDYDAAIQEMTRVDGLLIFQASNCNDQIPAKVYEYMRVRQPLLALTDPQGDTANMLRKCGVWTVANWNDKTLIKRELTRFIELIRAGRAPIAPDDMVKTYSRSFQSGVLAALLEGIS